LDLIEADACVKAEKLEDSILDGRPSNEVALSTIPVMVTRSMTGVASTPQQVQLAVFLGISLLQQHIVVMDVFVASLKANNFLDKLVPVVQS
jgi:hypothetical protein